MRKARLLITPQRVGPVATAFALRPFPGSAIQLELNEDKTEDAQLRMPIRQVMGTYGVDMAHPAPRLVMSSLRSHNLTNPTRYRRKLAISRAQTPPCACRELGQPRGESQSPPQGFGAMVIAARFSKLNVTAL
ncbi:hypothetical protein DM02DRAFT_672281 [Periconia macrospinosa]|uniref:Uncharacterized protein n=1 Tax=Periconia macrospinosa TaxID=97972 RepID=A0A2V1DRW7_9PLEO|nr:hypothetical protein DM02DRAFT_672281 [Periconia macrospinosa]